MLPPNRPHRRLIQLLALLLILSLPILCFARAGGGQSYSGSHSSGGGSHSGGGGSGGGDGAFWLIFQAVRLCIVYPKFGIPVVIVVIAGVVYVYRNGASAYT